MTTRLIIPLNCGLLAELLDANKNDFQDVLMANNARVSRPWLVNGTNGLLTKIRLQHLRRLSKQRLPRKSLRLNNRPL